MTGHIDQLTEWYESAERITKTNLPNKGDTLISPYEAGGFGIELERDGWTPNIVTIGEPVRILARAPKPKPAWHDAVAVIASKDYCERQVWERDTTYENRWYGTAGDRAVTSDLREVTPLIEAKVTDEARDRVWRELVHYNLIDPDKHRPSDPWTADVVHVALGLEAE